MNKIFRKIPKVDNILEIDKIKNLDCSNKILMSAIRRALDTKREKIKTILDENPSFDYEKKNYFTHHEKIYDKIKSNIDKIISEKEIVKEIINNIEKVTKKKLKRLINATGIVLHTNMGRSLIDRESFENAMEIACNYSNLEFDLETGKRGTRYNHLEDLLIELTGAEAVHIVNNNAAATMLVLSTMANEKEVIVSRGELVEIGGSFRIPDIMKISNAKLIEVGCTNKTHYRDYENAITEDTALLMKVHTSNYQIQGFTEEVELEELKTLSKEKDIAVYMDLGSGSLVDLSLKKIGNEPSVESLIKKGADIISFSGDKLLGSTQAGIIIGKKKYIEKMKKHQLTRAIRVDKVALSLLETSLRHYLDEEKVYDKIPSLRMLTMTKEELAKKSGKLKDELNQLESKIELELIDGNSEVGGGSLPTFKLDTKLLSIKSKKYQASEIVKKLRENKIPIIARINDERVLFDTRTIDLSEFDIIKEALDNIFKDI